jgi:hypothetical protein
MEPVRLYPLAVVPHERPPSIAALPLMALGAVCFVLAVVLGFLSDACTLAGRSAYDLSEGGHG